MFDVNKMLQQEMTFCESFTNKAVTGFGLIYYNPLNPLSWDSNHAHILKIAEDPGKAIQEIKRFFRSRNLVPRVYTSFISGELDTLRPYLESEGFAIDVYNSRWFYFPPGSEPAAGQAAPVRRITRITEDIIELINTTSDGGDWTVKVLQTHVKNTKFHLLGLFNQDRCVSIASVKTMDGYSRVDDVATHMEYRGQHFGTELISYLVGYHAGVSDNYLYLWADNPVAIGMYKNVGFKELSLDRPAWSAYLK